MSFSSRFLIVPDTIKLTKNTIIIEIRIPATTTFVLIVLTFQPLSVFFSTFLYFPIIISTKAELPAYTIFFNSYSLRASSNLNLALAPSV